MVLDHTIFLASDGKVYGCGLNNGNGQLGLGHQISPQGTIPELVQYFIENGLQSDGGRGLLHTLK